MTNKTKEALKLALEALEWFTAAEQGEEPPINKAITDIREALALVNEVDQEESSGTEQPAQPQLTELEKDAANLLFALYDAWPYVHGWCAIERHKQNIIHLMRKHGDFADLSAAQPQQEPDNWKDRLIAQHEETILWQAKRIGELMDQPAQPQQEPVAIGWYIEGFSCVLGLIRPEVRYEDWRPFYALRKPPAQRTWVGLTDEERDELLDIYITAEGRARAIEAKLKEKNT